MGGRNPLTGQPMMGGNPNAGLDPVLASISTQPLQMPGSPSVPSGLPPQAYAGLLSTKGLMGQPPGAASMPAPGGPMPMPAPAPYNPAMANPAGMAGLQRLFQMMRR